MTYERDEIYFMRSVIIQLAIRTCNTKKKLSQNFFSDLTQEIDMYTRYFASSIFTFEKFAKVRATSKTVLAISLNRCLVTPRGIIQSKVFADFHFAITCDFER